MRIIVVGKPGAGKTELAHGLADKLAVPRISSGDVLRARAKEPSEQGRMIADRLASGRLMPPGMVDRLMAERLAQTDLRSGWVLDGYPRRISEVRALARLGAPVPDAVLYLAISDEQALARLAKRATCPACGQAAVSSTGAACQTCGESLEQRDDDTVATARRRLEVFRTETLPILGAYADLLIRLPSSGPAEEVLAEALAALPPG